MLMSIYLITTLVQYVWVCAYTRQCVCFEVGVKSMSVIRIEHIACSNNPVISCFFFTVYNKIHICVIGYRNLCLKMSLNLPLIIHNGTTMKIQPSALSELSLYYTANREKNNYNRFIFMDETNITFRYHRVLLSLPLSQRGTPQYNT